jgi:hypothetical protein
MNLLLAQAALEASIVRWEQVLMGLTTIASLLVAISAWRKSSATASTATTVAAAVASAQSKECAVDHSAIRSIILEQNMTLKGQSDHLKQQTESLTKMVDSFTTLANSLALRDQDIGFHHKEVVRLLMDISKKLETE